MKRTVLFGASLSSALLASLCCIGPLLVTATGVSTFAAAGALEAWRPYLLILTGVLLSGGLFLVYRQSKATCAPGVTCSVKPLNRAGIGLSVLLALSVITIAAFPYYSGVVVRAATKETPEAGTTASLKTVRFSVLGMTCPSCARGLEASFRNLAGVKEATVDYEGKRTAVTFDPAKQNAQSLKKLITDSGYQVKE